MRNIDLETILKATGGQALAKPHTQFSGIATDTRKAMNGQIFWALKGESFDAHNFISQAIAQGAMGIVVHDQLQGLEEIGKTTTVIKVKDTLKALQDLGHHARTLSPAKIIGITGSNGKTTSKEFAAAVLAAGGLKVHYSKGSFNNHWGVPFSLLAEPAGTQVSIIEMGMNHAGELTELCKIAEPDIIVCTMVGRAHIEYFGTIDKIAEAKNEVYEHSPKNAIRIYNLDNPYTNDMFRLGRQKFPKLQTFSSKDSTATVFLKITEMSMKDLKVKGKINGIEGETTIPVFGTHNLTNILVAASTALAGGMTPEQIWKGLSACKTNWGRNQLVHTAKGAELLFDAYNANPDSMKALIDNIPLLKCSGKKIGVFAQMRELGEQSAKFHRELGEQVSKAGFDAVWFYGADATAFQEGAGNQKSLFVSNTYEESLATKLASMLRQGDLAVIKGSRGEKMERFVLHCEPTDFSLEK